jgi:hypothetical protein
MNTSSVPIVQLSLPQLQEVFLAIQPRLLRHAHIYFRHVRCRQRRADHIAEMIGLCWKWFRSMAQRGKDARLFVCALARYAARAVSSGRRVCGQQKSWDVLSPLAQRCHGFRVETLPATTRTTYEDLYSIVNGQQHLDFLEERLHDNSISPVPEQVTFRIDFPAWLRTCTERDRRIIADMAHDERTSDLARKYRVSAGRISQLRRAYQTDWQRFCDDLPTQPA